MTDDLLSRCSAWLRARAESYTRDAIALAREDEHVMSNAYWAIAKELRDAAALIDAEACA